MIEFTLIIMRWSSSQIKEHVTIFWQRHYWIMVGFDGPIISMISPSNQSNPYKTLNNWTTKGKFFHTCFFCLLFLETLWLTWYLEISPTRANRGACHLYISHGLHWKHNLWYFNFSLEPIIFIITCPTSFLKIFKSRAHLKLVGRLQFMFKCLKLSLTENILDNKLQSLWLNNKFALNLKVEHWLTLHPRHICTNTHTPSSFHTNPTLHTALLSRNHLRWLEPLSPAISSVQVNIWNKEYTCTIVKSFVR